MVTYRASLKQWLILKQLEIQKKQYNRYVFKYSEYLTKRQENALNHVKSNRKKSGESSKNLTQNRSLMRAEKWDWI